MPARPLSDEQLREALEAVARHGGTRAAAAALGVSRPTLQHRLNCAYARGLAAPPTGPPNAPHRAQPGLTREGDQKNQLITSISEKIRTVDQALETAEVDRRLWDVDRFTINSWETAGKHPETGAMTVVTLFQVKVWLKAADPMGPRALRDVVLAEIAERGPRYTLKVARRVSRRGRSAPPQGVLCELALFDLHLGKLAWAPETGENYDTAIAQRVYEWAVEQLLERVAGWPVERFLLPVGNDLLHVDGPGNTTTSGTAVDADGRWQKSFQVAWRMLARSIETLAAAAPVEVLVVPGNHDRQRSFYVGEVLAARFAQAGPRIRVDNAPTLRKYVRFGATLLGFTHGCDEPHDRLESIMVNERPEDFTGTQCREWHLGHWHKRRAVKYTAADTHGGTVVRILPSLSGTDAWHYAKGYVKGPRAAEAYLYDGAGYAGHVAVHPPPGIYAA